MKFRSVVIILALAVFQGLGAGQDKSEERLVLFETIWSKVNETYFDPSFGGLDWKKVHDGYRPQIAAAKSEPDVHALLNKMLWELKVSHTAYIPRGYFATVEPTVFAPGGIGLDMRLFDGQAMVTAVGSESPAQKAGLRRGVLIQAIDGIPIAQIERDVRRDRPPYNDRGRRAQITKGVLSRIYGAPGTEVGISFMDERGEKREKKMMRAKRSGAAVGPGGLFFFAVEFEARRLDDGVGHIRLNTLQPELAARIPAAVKSMGGISGLIIDLRGNSGGEIEGMAELFLPDKTFLYIRKARSGETKVYSAPAENVYQGPLVLLIDELSGSASELFAACLQAAKRAVVVGQRSPGSVMESDNKIFGNGAVLMYPVAQLSTPDHIVLEGYGVVPDIEIELDRGKLLEGIDSQLDAALRYLRDEKRKKPGIPMKK